MSGRSTVEAPSGPLPPLALRAWLRYDVVSRILDEVQPRRVLEIGCGQGAFGARLAGRVDYLGLEPDRSSYEVAARRIEARGGKVINGTTDALMAGQSFDAVCAFEVLEHIEDDRGALAAWRNFVAPEGHLVLSVPAFPDRFGPMDIHAGHFRRYSADDLDERLREAGFHVERIVAYGWPLGYALEAVRNRIDARKLEAARESGTSITELTAASGRTFQPARRSSGLFIQAATLPFRYMQRARSGHGTGLVALARRPR